MSSWASESMRGESRAFRIALLDDFAGIGERVFRERLGSGFEIESFRNHDPDPESLVHRLQGADCFVMMRERTPIPAEVIEKLPELRLIVTTGLRNASLDVAAASAAGIAVSGTRSQGEPTVELTWALILAALRGLPSEIASVSSGGWQQSVGRGLTGCTIGVVGLGRVGLGVARVARAFGLEVQSWSPTLSPERAKEAGITFQSKEAFFATSDVVTLHTKLTDQTRRLVGKTELEMMPASSIVVNTSRSEIVDLDALLEAVDRGSIAGAALDVHPTEPLPEKDPVRTHPRVIATPHIGYSTVQNHELQYSDAVDAVLAFLDGMVLRRVEMGTPGA